MAKAEQNTFFEENLACVHEKHLLRKRTLLKVGTAGSKSKLCLPDANNRQLKPQARICNDRQVRLYELQVPQE